MMLTNKCAWIMIVVISLASAGASQTLVDQARQSSGEPVITSLLFEIPPKTIEEIAKTADFVVQATLVKAKSYLGVDEQSVLTDFHLVSPRILRGTLPLVVSAKPGVIVPLVLSVYGGTVTVNGVQIIATNHSMTGELKDGAEYLLFLRKFGNEPGHYQIHNGGVFMIEQDHARALIIQAQDVLKGAARLRVTELVERIKRAE